MSQPTPTAPGPNSSQWPPSSTSAVCSSSKRARPSGVAATLTSIQLVLGRHNVILTVAGATALLPLVLLVGLRSGTLPRPVGALLVLAYVATAGFLLAR